MLSTRDGAKFVDLGARLHRMHRGVPPRIFSQICSPRGEIHDTQGDLFFFSNHHPTRGGNPDLMLLARKSGRGRGGTVSRGENPGALRYVMVSSSAHQKTYDVGLFARRIHSSRLTNGWKLGWR